MLCGRAEPTSDHVLHVRASATPMRRMPARCAEWRALSFCLMGGREGGGGEGAPRLDQELQAALLGAICRVLEQTGPIGGLRLPDLAAEPPARVQCAPDFLLVDLGDQAKYGKPLSRLCSHMGTNSRSIARVSVGARLLAACLGTASVTSR